MISILHLGIYLKNMKILILEIYVPLCFFATSFMKQPKCLIAVEWINVICTYILCVCVCV